MSRSSSLANKISRNQFSHTFWLQQEFAKTKLNSNHNEKMKGPAFVHSRERLYLTRDKTYSSSYRCSRGDQLLLNSNSRSRVNQLNVGLFHNTNMAEPNLHVGVQ